MLQQRCYKKNKPPLNAHNPLAKYLVLWLTNRTVPQLCFAQSLTLVFFSPTHTSEPHFHPTNTDYMKEIQGVCPKGKVSL